MEITNEKNYTARHSEVHSSDLADEPGYSGEGFQKGVFQKKL